MFSKIMNIAASAMAANRMRINTISSNIANSETTRTAEGGPYKRRDVVLAATDVATKTFGDALHKAALQGVKVVKVVTDNQPPRQVYDPGHPDANAEGMVAMPNINTVTEMVNLMTASQSYKAAAEIVGITKDLSAALRRVSQG